MVLVLTYADYALWKRSMFKLNCKFSIFHPIFLVIFADFDDILSDLRRCSRKCRITLWFREILTMFTGKSEWSEHKQINILNYKTIDYVIHIPYGLYTEVLTFQTMCATRAWRSQRQANQRPSPRGFFGCQAVHARGIERARFMMSTSRQLINC